MIYLDYCATTPTDEKVLESFCKVSRDFIGNPNSMHKLGVEAKNLIDASTSQLASFLNVKEKEIIYTSGSSEANNLAIKGVCERYQKLGNHIITTELEHSSIYGPINYLLDKGFEVDFVKLDQNGQVDLEDLKKLIKDTTILVTINAVNSEIGIEQPIEQLADFLKDYPKIKFHVDMTQALGKINISFKNIDLISFSAHKFYGIKGIGCLVKKEKTELTPLIHGGKSTTNYRSGTPTVSLIVSLAKALRLANENLNQKFIYVQNLNSYIKEQLEKIDNVYINSNAYSIPHIINISILGVKPETMQHALEENEIYVSTKSACSSTDNASKAVLAITGDLKRASSSIRISLSHLTTKEEIDIFLEALKKCIERLVMKK